MSIEDTANRNNETFMNFDEALNKLSGLEGIDDQYIKELEKRLNKFRENLKTAKTAEELMRLETKIHTYLSELSKELSNSKLEKHQKEFVAIFAALKNSLQQMIKQAETKMIQPKDTSKYNKKEQPKIRQEDKKLIVKPPAEKSIIAKINAAIKNIFTTGSKQVVNKSEKPKQANFEIIKVELDDQRSAKPKSDHKVSLENVKQNTKIDYIALVHIIEKHEFKENSSEKKEFVNKVILNRNIDDQKIIQPIKSNEAKTHQEQVLQRKADLEAKCRNCL